MIRGLSLVLALLSLLSGCAESSGAQAKAPARELPADVGSMLARSGAAYGGPVVASGADQPALRKAYEDRVLPRTRATIRHEPALDLVAQVLAAIYLQTRSVPALSLEQWLFWRCGATAIPAGFDILAFFGDDPGPALDKRLGEVAARQKGGSMPQSYGLVRVTFAAGVAGPALVVAGRPVEGPAVKKAFAPGEEMLVAVRPTLPYTSLTVYADAGGGDVKVVPMTANADQSYWAKVVLPSRPGRYFVQVAATEPAAESVDPEHPFRHGLLHLPVYVGVPEPTEPDEFIRHPVPNPPDVATWRELVLRAYNGERARLGRAPLVVDPRAVTVAQRRSDEVAATPGSPRPDPHVAEELAAVGIPVQEVGNSLGSLEFVSEYVHMRLLEPAARHHLLSPETKLLALGLSQRPGDDGVRPWSVVEYAIQPLGPLDVPKERSRVYAELAARDTAEQKPPIQRDDPRGSVAQHLAEEICKRTRTPDDGKGIDERLRRAGVRPFSKGGRYSWVGYHFSRAEIARVREGAKGNGYTRVGVGICQGDLPERPKGTFVLMIMGG